VPLQLDEAEQLEQSIPPHEHEYPPLQALPPQLELEVQLLPQLLPPQLQE
jgi:hypothetical protein